MRTSAIGYSSIVSTHFQISGVNLGGGVGGGGAQAPSGLAIAPPRFIPKALRNGKV